MEDLDGLRAATLAANVAIQVLTTTLLKSGALSKGQFETHIRGAAGILTRDAAGSDFEKVAQDVQRRLIDLLNNV